MEHSENIEPAQTDSGPESSPESSIEQRERMRLLIAELVKTNQELRFRVARLKERIERLEKGLPDGIPWAGMLI
jgi:hypothetical protein